jgi:integrase
VGVRVKFYRGAWWVFVAFRNRRRSKKVGDRQTANRLAQRIRERLAAGDLQLKPAQQDETFEVYARGWLVGLTGNLKASTIKFYTDNLQRHVLPTLGPRLIRSVSRSDCREVITTARSKGLKLNTVRGIARTLSTVLSQAVEEEKLPANPALRMGRYLRRGDEAKTPIQVLSREEAALLVATAQTHFPRWHPWVLLALRTGLRLGEQIALQWGDVDWNGRFVLVQRNSVRGVLTSPKSHRRPRVDLSSQLVSTLLDWRRLQQARSMEKGTNSPQWIFPSLSGTPLEERNIRHVFKRMLEKAALRQIRIHDLRHTFASLLLQQGESVVYVKEQLGHASIQITVDTYGHLIPGANRGAVDRLDDDLSMHPFASQAHPDAPTDNAVERPKFFRLNGEPPRNRTENPQIKSLLLCQLS